MALNKKVFQTRALTAIVFAAVMLAGICINFTTFLILFSVIHFGCWFEYFKIVEKIKNITFPFLYKASLMCGAYAVALSFNFFPYLWSGYEIWSFFIPVFGIASFVLLIYSLMKMKQSIFSSASFSALAGVLYISFPIGMVIWLYASACFPNPDACAFGLSTWLILFIIFSIWINDTMAYIVGSFIGKTPFSKISPKKTWEGTGGGAILSIVVMTAIGIYATPYKYVAWYHWAVISALCAVFGTLGDLLESKLKRMAGLKDSGTIMPGHGGFLDRFDSLLIAIPAVWIYFKCFVMLNF